MVLKTTFAERECDGMINILAVDNNKQSLCVLRKAIEEAVDRMKCKPDIKVHGFLSSYEALVFAKENPVDIVFTESEMSDFDCIELINQLRRINRYVNAILVTENEKYAEQTLMMNMRLSGYILKPPDADAILNELFNLWYPVKGIMAI